MSTLPVQTLEGHGHNVSAVMFHPELPVILTGSEDGSVRIWHSTTYRLENTLNYGMERVWALAYSKGSNSYVPFCHSLHVILLRMELLHSHHPVVTHMEPDKKRSVSPARVCSI